MGTNWTGGDGNDFYSASDDFWWWDSWWGWSPAVDDSLKGGEGYDTIYGNRGMDTIEGEGGNDELHGGEGDDYIYGGSGNDSIWGDQGFDYIDGGDGFDTVYYSGNIANYGLGWIHDTNSIFVEDKQDIHQPPFFQQPITTVDTLHDIECIRFNDAIVGGLDSTWIVMEEVHLAYGMDGDDIIFGGIGNDTIYGNSGNYVFRGSDNDYLYGGGGDDEIHGEEGNDTLSGGTDNDRLFGDGGNDLIYAGDYDDVWGGDGIDTVCVSGNASQYGIIDFRLVSGEVAVWEKAADGTFYPNGTFITMRDVEYIQFNDQTVQIA